MVMICPRCGSEMQEETQNHFECVCGAHVIQFVFFDINDIGGPNEPIKGDEKAE